MRKLNITKDVAEDRKQWRQLIPCPTPDDDDDDDDDVDVVVVVVVVVVVLSVCQPLR